MSEEKEQIALCQYMRLQYPSIIFSSDHSGIRVSQGLANKVKKLHSENGIPDLTIYEPRGGYYGLCIELKATGNSPFRKTGMLRDNEHLRKGYLAGFCTGFDEAKQTIDWYMSLPIEK
jgi:hypothetical protein